MNKEQFSAAIREKVVLADFSATWCSPCRAMAPMIKDLAEKYEGQVEVLDIDIDSYKELATDYVVQSIPTLILFKNGDEVKRFIGLQSLTVLERAIDHLLQTTDDFQHESEA